METKCIHCGKTYETKRESSLYCSNGCRTSAYKYRKRREQYEKEQQEIRKAQKVIDDRLKLVDDEKRKEKADKRRKAKEDKALKTAQEKVPNSENIIQQDSVTVIPDTKTENEQKLTAKPEIKEAALQNHSTSIIQGGIKRLKKSKSESTNQFDFHDFIARLAKAMEDSRIKKK